MTKEEVIERIEGLYDIAKHESLDDEEDKEALDMAIKALEQEPCEDAISRKDLLSKAWFVTGDDFPMEGLEYVTKGMVENMSSVNPQPKTGHWIMIDKELQRYKCSECGEVIRLYKKSEIPKLEKDETLSNYPFSHCGCRMVDPQESEGKE